MKATIDEMEKCEDDNEFGCSTKKKDELLEKASKVQEDNDAAMTKDKKREEMMKKFQGGLKESDGKTEKAPMSVKLPDGCTTKEDCNWICTHMAKASGADFNAVDMKSLESMDGTTKYTKSRRRMLEGENDTEVRVLTGGTTLENSVTNDGSGYEPDSTENTEGLDSSFSETVDSDVPGVSSGKMFTNSWTIGFSLVAILATLLQRQ